MRKKELEDPLYRARRLKTLAHNKRGRRVGDIAGYTRDEVRRLRKQALRRAERILKRMEDEGLIDPIDPDDIDRTKVEQHAEGIVDDDAKAARTAMKEVIVQVLMPGPKKDKLAAARTILEFTKAKPTSKTDVNVTAPEDFLVGLLAKETHKD
jgi:hypothetical protein